MAKSIAPERLPRRVPPTKPESFRFDSGGILMTRNPFVRTLGSLATILLLSLVAFAKDEQKAAFPQVRIKNFGQMDERFYRGAEPKKLEDFQALKQLGVHTVIDLQAEPASAERGMVESVGMRYVNIPMVDQVYAEMKQYDFYTSWGHGDFKTFVEDYWKQMQARGPRNATTNAVAAGATTPAAVKTTKASAVEGIFTG